ncbi:HlyD family efflux transporter periplasmic adaptor subunit [Rudanella paleaurantiibacter]|uniref:HlyD family efflux transporter periplasmic adaptor subunit n=1 Tax=Rudanella paleaurantiibacter TaxID=2614655 RepID=A0A7J5TZY2_9BACT|nr:HlyD family efflux transporter periplasmic adaptor subunit [Rudanella paleaurantiibacter]KAB7731052.1 HlyD family efflux transporter periplasmic adaptor subunit [Rudanella paleaurantiibacter]
MLNLSKQRVDEQLWKHYPLRTLRSLPELNTSRRLGRVMIGILIGVVILLFLPWQQNITGDGSLTALTPQDRPQTVQNAIAGRIERWAVAEGDKVRRGDTLLVISEIKDEYFDPNLPLRLSEQLDAKRGSMDATDAKIQALDGQMAALKAGLEVKLASAKNKVKQARFKVVSDSTDLIAVRNFYQTARVRLDRYEEAHRNGLISLTDLETRRLKFAEDQAKVVAQENKLNVARQELANARLDLTEIQADYSEKMAKSLSDRSSAVSYRADAMGEVSKLRNKISSVDVRRGLYIIRAPQDGYVVKALKAGIGETIKEGESIATLQPDKPSLAVELYVRAMDVPLITPGRKVRLQFDGWPAVQFSGWPTVAVGTFGGQVAVVDAVSSTNGKYRLLVRPDNGDQAWPPQLRQGSGVYGWVMLDDVPIWYEIWRQLNGFPPSLKAEPEPTEGAKK